MMFDFEARAREREDEKAQAVDVLQKLRTIADDLCKSVSILRIEKSGVGGVSASNNKVSIAETGGGRDKLEIIVNGEDDYSLWVLDKSLGGHRRDKLTKNEMMDTVTDWLDQH